jgi:hypothetical protein
VFLTFRRGEFADQAYKLLRGQRKEIDREIGIPVLWESADDKHKIVERMRLDDIRSDDHRAEVKDFFADRVNRFVNVFRPRLERIVESM